MDGCVSLYSLYNYCFLFTTTCKAINRLYSRVEIHKHSSRLIHLNPTCNMLSFAHKVSESPYFEKVTNTHRLLDFCNIYCCYLTFYVSMHGRALRMTANPSVKRYWRKGSFMIGLLMTRVEPPVSPAPYLKH